MEKRGKKENNVFELKPPVGPSVSRAVVLIMGKWKNFLTEYECKVIIARALNDCVYKGGMDIMGYLITNEKIFLVLKISKEEFSEIMMLFFKLVVTSLKKHFSTMGKRGVPFLPAKDVIEPDEHFENIFEEYIFDDAGLIAILTGKEMENDYGKDNFEQMKKWLNNYQFCSFRTYEQGVSGPVVLKSV